MRAHLILLSAFLLAATAQPQQAPSADPAAASGAPARSLEQPTPRPKSKTVPIDAPALSYYAVSTGVLDHEVHTIPASDADRLARLKTAFTQVDCTGDRMRIQDMKDGQNLICTWPGKDPSTIVVVAHYPHKGKGEGAVDDWSGAALLPYLYLAVQAAPRTNTYVFLESTGKKGNEEYLKSLSKQQKKDIRAVVDLMGLGVSPVPRFYTPSDTADPKADAFHLQLEFLYSTFSDSRLQLPQPLNPQRWITTDDTEAFRFSQTPAIIIHSIPQTSVGLPGSAQDTAAAVDTANYYWNYRTIAIYLAALDGVAEKLATNDPLWGAGGSGYRLNLNDLPWVH